MGIGDMRRRLLAAAALAAATTWMPATFIDIALAQDAASINSAAPTVIEPVVAKCEIVAANPEQADPTDGICIGATKSFVSSLAGLPAADADQSITDLVVALAALVQQDLACDANEDEIAAAIRYAATATSNPDQLAQLNEIAQTIDDCSTGATAALDSVPDSPA